MPDLIGQSLGRYHILEKLGEGGMAVVYKAYDTHLECDVAVKVIRIDDLPRSAEERALKRFEREAKALAKLDHPNIVKVMDYGEYEGSPYLVMPYLPGGTLKQYFKNKRRLDWREAVGLLLPITRALAYAHDEGVIHRDVKPSNILLTTSGEPMLTDFGVAKVIDEEVTQDLTGTSATVGTPEYMAPEQVISKTVDHRADIYALGVVMFEMVTGRRPYEADTPMAVLFKHASDPLPRPRDLVPDLPEQVEQVLLKALAKKPDDRYQDMGEFTSALKKMEIAEQRIDDSQTQLIKEALSHNENPTTLNTVDQTEKKHEGDDRWAFPANDKYAETPREGVRVPVAVPPSYDDAVIPEENINVLETNLDASQPVLADSIESRPFPPRYASAYQLTYENTTPSSRPWKWVLLSLIGIGGIVAILGLLTNLQNRNVMTTGSNSTSTTRVKITSTTVARINSTTSGVAIENSTFTKTPPTPTKILPTPTIEILTVGSSRTRESDGMEMFYIPEGEFIMGSEDNKGLENEYPQHSVFLNSFWMDRTEITNAMYEECVKENVCSEPAYLMTMSRDTYFYDDQYNAYPVIAVNWDQANTYCQWVGSRLPTEAEWEKAARGTDGRQYPWGDFSPNESLANCNDNLGDTAEVGSYPEGSSPYGVLDLSGNVFEWVADWYGVYQSDDTKNPLGPSSGENRIIRGGAFELGNIHLRATYRGEIEPEATYFDIGFRCAMDGK